MSKLPHEPQYSYAYKLEQLQKQVQVSEVKRVPKLQREMLLAQKEEVDFIAFSGGGAKGAIYSGVVEALKISGTLEGVKAVAGSSAGAITAAFVASGIDPKNFENLSKNTNLKGLLGKGALPGNILPINQDGNPLYDLLATTIKENILNFLTSSNLAELCDQNIIRLAIKQEEITKRKQALLNEHDANAKEILRLTEQSQLESDLAAKNRIVDRIELLETQQKSIENNIKGLIYQHEDYESQVSKIKAMVNDQWVEVRNLEAKCVDNSDGSKINFKDLALMRLLDPIRFKDLFVTAVRRDTGELEIFSASTTPDVEIALACRASASIPIVFQPVTINGHEYVDGGYRDNVPTKYFKNHLESQGIEDISDNPERTAEAKKQRRTLAFAFGGGSVNDKLHVAIYSAEKLYEPNAIIKFIKDVLFKFIAKVGGIFKYTETERDTLNSLRENALNTVPLDTRNVGTLSFDEAQQKAEYLHIKGYIETMGHLQNHEIGASHDKDHLYKKFLLGVYERLEERPSAMQPWSAKINESLEDKKRALLSFAKAEKWVGQECQTILGEYVALAATKRGINSNNKLSNDTNTMSLLIEKLNADDAPTKIKKEFIKLLDIDIKSTPQYDHAKSYRANAANFEFEKEHFNNLLAKSTPHPSLNQNIAQRIR